ncbi:hypothetical protein [Holospora elegans]|uniref:hypothetical protein n=1 Tax=Holospora elegans TaxID=431043 RepID=UPI00139F29CE|nr:hypothetical protein [Holospora elegans]
MVCKISPPLANTRSLEMLEVTLSVFAALHVDKTLRINVISLVKGINNLLFICL